MIVCALGLAAVAGAAAWALAARPSASARTGIGRQVADFALPDALGRTVALRDLVGRRAVVVAFLGTECPLANLYLPRLVELERSYRDRGVAFVAINANANEPAAEVAAHAREHGLTFPVLKDERSVVADRLGVERTCEALVLDAAGVLRYRGAIDDQFERGTRRPEPTRRHLVEAIEAVLGGRRVVVATTEVIGCPIGRAEPSPSSRPRLRPASPELIAAYRGAEPAAEVGPVTFARDVAPILAARCRGCHAPGRVAPFSLTTYAQALKWSSAIREVVEERRMPPWHADPRFGHFANDRSLSAREYATLLAWVDQGSPPGALPNEPNFAEPPDLDAWSIGRPDLIIPMPETFEVPAQGVVSYQRFVVPLGLSEDRWVRAAEAKPGERSVVHHIAVYVFDRAASPPIRDVLAIYAPGEPASAYPEGVARLIPAGSDLLFEVHYTPTGTARSDRSRLGLAFRDGPPRRRVRTKSVCNQALYIPPGEPDFRHEATYTFPTDARLVSVMPHMHMRGKDFRCTLTYPDGRSEVVLSVPAFDFGWQEAYRLAEPLPLPRGTRMECVAHFDNSAANPANPDPTKAVGWGEQSWDEVMVAYTDYCEDLPTAMASIARSDGLAGHPAASNR
jgi:peroxiredoxin